MKNSRELRRIFLKQPRQVNKRLKGENMRISIKYKLFFTLFLTTSIVVAGMYFFMQWSFHRGFLNYANTQDMKNMESLTDRLTRVYEADGGWESLRRNLPLWRSLQADSIPVPDDIAIQLPPVRPIEDTLLPDRDPLRIGPRTMLLDTDKQLVIGGRNNPADIENRNASLTPLVVNGKTVGYLAIVPMTKLSDASDILYVEKQTRIFGIIALASLLVSMLLAIPLIRHLLVPVNAMIHGAERLTSGDYNVRIPVTTGDELARLSEHFNLLATTLERNEQSRRRYMADVSHDLRTPLAILLGEIEAIQDGVREVEPTLPVLHSEVKHLNRLVGDLYELSLSDVGALSYRKHPIDPVIALEQVVEKYAPRMKDRDIELMATLPGEGTLSLNADPNRLQQLFTNLLENSLRYTDPGGRVEVIMHREDSDLKVTIQDSAPGVPEEALPKLFARLYRVEASRNRDKGGSGLGLAICWNIVEAHEGRIETHPSSLGGLKVEVTLPL